MTKFLKDNKIEEKGNSVMHVFETAMTLINEFKNYRPAKIEGRDEDIDNILNTLKTDFEDYGCEL